MSAPPTLDLRLLADDLTGALDSAAAFAGSVPVGLGAVPADPVAGQAIAPPAALRVSAVATATRDVPPADLPAQLGPLLDWFGGGDLAFKKVDSLLRGNTFAECAWLARAGGFDGVVFAPAFPAQRRVTVGGRQQVLPAAGAGGDAVPVGPATAEGFAAQGLRSRVAAVAAVDLGADAGAGDAGGPSVWVPEVHDDADLQALARRACAVSRGRWLWCGSAGLAQALAAALGAAAVDGAVGVPPVDAAPAGARGVLMLGASHHPVVRRQWARLRAAWPAAITVREGDAAAFDAACAAMAGPFDIAALELSPATPLGAAEAAALLERQLAALVRRVRPPAALGVIGGDTLLGLCRATGVASLHTLPARRPGWGCARFVGGVWNGLVCHARSGAFGDDDDLAAMLRAVMAR